MWCKVCEVLESKYRCEEEAVGKSSKSGLGDCQKQGLEFSVVLLWMVVLYKIEYLKLKFESHPTYHPLKSNMNVLSVYQRSNRHIQCHAL